MLQQQQEYLLILVLLEKGHNVKSQLVAIVNDVHFDLHDTPTWRAFRKWHKDVRPDKTVFLGDFLDLGMMSRYTQGKDDPLYAIPQIKCFVKEANALIKETGELIVLEGNHDERWSRYLHGATPHVLKGALGLTLKDQCISQGLDSNVTWVREDLEVKGVPCGPFLLRHGHNQSGRFGGGKHLAANRIAKSMGQSEIFGHHHRAQLFCQTAHGRTAISVASPCITGDHDYCKDPDWQRGFTILEVFEDSNGNFVGNPYIVIAQEGRFSYNRKVYDGNV